MGMFVHYDSWDNHLENKGYDDEFDIFDDEEQEQDIDYYDDSSMFI